MLAAERHAAILRELAVRSAVRVTALARTLGVSEMTVRRDIDALEARGALLRVHGGAVPVGSPSAEEPGFDVNRTRAGAAKRAIAAAAVTLLAPGMTVSVTGGTTTYALAPLLSRLRGLTVIPNSLPLADELHRLGAGAPAGTAPQVLLSGGSLTPSKALVGPLATATVSSLHADVCFMGAHGVDLAAGITTPNPAEAGTNRAFAGTCATHAVLADAGKLGVVGLARVVALEGVSVLVTDHPPDAGYAARTRILPATEPHPSPEDSP
ncbi:DeoR faimly transcriptional regulator [Arthrobacter sp. RIT-PI-e]|uniref:DeoR/GlpR family DNA-binding transcription regulator n=1 Tax=Arthrobacter sp. RIT-PI-e TaxID=1681197 RepID=UPI0006765FA9|nr:DeoR/GlpR family DNA-binding transcription regulator [Arthrobacter sp. RIT-PI-e]KNC19775.1 DeoR faimly transcriptional regulator [Arthrobacter sp. RIT-PI-e]